MKKKYQFRVTSQNAEWTQRIGTIIGQTIQPGSILTLEGELGSGKTIFVQGLAKGLKLKKASDVRSPTFALIQEYTGKKSLCHVDLYRVTSEEASGIGLEDYWNPSVTSWIVAIEWPDRALELLPQNQERNPILHIHLEHRSKETRKITFSTTKKNWRQFNLWKKRLLKK